MISFHCPRCKHHVTRPLTDAGQKITYPGCPQRLLVPQPKSRPPVDDSPTVMGELTPVNAGMLVPSPPPVPVQATLLTNPPLRCSCPHCQASINVDPQRAGSRIPCPRCKLPFEIPLVKARLMEESPAQPLMLPVVAQLDDDSAEITVKARPKPGMSAASIILLVSGLSVLLIVGVCFGVATLLMLGGSNQAQEAQVARLRNQIDNLETQMQALDIEYNAAMDRRDFARATSLGDQIASKYEEQASLLDTLAAKLGNGKDRDECVRAAATSRTHAQRVRLMTATIRSNL